MTIEAVVRTGSYDFLFIDRAPTDVSEFALARAARCRGISGVDVKVVQRVDDAAGVATVAAGDGLPWALCLAADADDAWAAAEQLARRGAAPRDGAKPPRDGAAAAALRDGGDRDHPAPES